jgi:hypothetical protein
VETGTEPSLEIGAEELISHLRCPHHLECRASTAEEVRGVGSESLMGLSHCMRSNAGQCPHSLFAGRRYLCRCPLRVYLREILRDELQSVSGVPA